MDQKEFTKGVIDIANKMENENVNLIVIESVKSDLAKKLHTEGLYTEKEVKDLIMKHNGEMCELYWVSIDDEWFENNKKKQT